MKIRHLSIFLIFIPLVFTLTSCNENEANSNTSQAKAVFDEAIEIHDVAMVYMTKMGQLHSQLKAKTDSMQAASTTDTDSINSGLFEEYKNAQQQLTEAQDRMMTWMHTLEPLPQEITEEKKTETLETQKRQLNDIKTIKAEMEASIKTGEQLLNITP